MLAYKELQDIIKTTLIWEQHMRELYEVAQIGVKNENSKKTITYLMENHIAHMDVLKNLRVTDFGPTEWVKFTGDFKEEALIPKKGINKNSTSRDVCTAILEYEKKLKGFYEVVATHLSTEKQMELFQSLVRFKENQISQIQNCMNVID